MVKLTACHGIDKSLVDIIKPDCLRHHQIVTEVKRNVGYKLIRFLANCETSLNVRFEDEWIDEECGSKLYKAHVIIEEGDL